MTLKLEIVIIAPALAAAACSSAEGAGSGEPANVNPGTTGELQGNSAGTEVPSADRGYFDGNLDQGYLLGTWCDSQGLTWVFTGGEVQVGTDQASLGEPYAIEKTFSEPGAKFVVNLGDEFTIEQLGQEIVFTRGSCDGSATESIGAATGADIADVVILCGLIDENQEELATMAGFKANGDKLIGSEDLVGARCSINGRADQFIVVTVFADPAITIKMAAQAFDDASAVAELGESAVYVTTADDLVDGFNVTLFAINDQIVRVESGIAWVSIPRNDLIKVSQRIQEILTEAG